MFRLKLKNKLAVALCLYGQGKIHLDSIVTAYPMQTHNTENTGQLAARLMIRLAWCHSLFWNQMPLKWYSIGVAPRTHVLPPVGVGSWAPPQSTRFLSTRTHSLAWAPVCQYHYWTLSIGLPWSVMSPWCFWNWRPKTEWQDTSL